MKTLGYYVAFVIGAWFLAYGAGAWLGEREANEKWTDNRLNAYVQLHGYRSGGEAIVPCGDDKEVLSTDPSKLTPELAQAALEGGSGMTRFSSSQAVVVAGVLGASGTGLTKAVGEMATHDANSPKLALTIAAIVSGGLLGYDHHREKAPACERKNLEKVLKLYKSTTPAPAPATGSTSLSPAAIGSAVVIGVPLTTLKR